MADADYLDAARAAGAECLDAALYYLSLGWSPLAVCPPDHIGVGRAHGKSCGSPGKAPWGEWKAYQDRPPTADELRSRWKDNPLLNVGLALGPVSGLVRVDVEGTGGEAKLLELSGGDLPPTLEFTSGRADGTGRGLLYAVPPGAALRTTPHGAGQNGEVRLQAKGAQTVLPPSRHKDGTRYAWKPGRGPREIAPAPAPGWLLEALRPAAPSGERAEALADGELIPKGRRDDTLASMAGTMRKRGFDREAIEAALRVTNEARCDPPLSDDDVRRIAGSVSRYAPDEMADVRILLPGAEAPPGKEPLPFAEPIPASLLRKADKEARWLLQGILARGFTTMLSALWKAGKTTLIAYLLKALETGGQFCGLGAKAGRVLYVTEEHESLWADRRDLLALTDNVHFLVRPFAARPGWERWQQFVAYLRDLRRRTPFDLLVLDPISNLWPVRDENDAPQVQSALLPLQSIDEAVAILLIHHLRKGDGAEATAARGSGALAAFCDSLMELRRYDPSNRKDRRRVLTGYGRFEETPDELVVELAADRSGFIAHGDRADTSYRDLQRAIEKVLPAGKPGMTQEEIAKALVASGRGAAKQRITDALDDGCKCRRWAVTGDGAKRDPYRYHANEKGPDSVPNPLGSGTESGGGLHLHRPDKETI